MFVDAHSWLSWIIIVILECTKVQQNLRSISCRKSSCDLFVLLETRIREQSMWCKSEVSLNKYGHHHISTNCFVFVREILPLLKNTIQRLGYQQLNREKKNLCFLHLVDREKKWQQGFAPKITRRQNLIDQSRTWKPG